MNCLILPLILFTLQPVGIGTLMPENSRCEYLVNPLGIDATQPRLSWELRAVNTKARGLKQSAYQVLVATSPELLAEGKADLWESGKVDSDETLGIAYSGKPLKSRNHGYWKVRVWDQLGEPSEWSPMAHFSVGLLKPSDWTAQWITAPEFIPDSPKHVGYMSLETKNPNEPKWVQIDLGAQKSIDGIRLYPAAGRRGENPEGGEIPPGDGFPLRFKVDVSDRADMTDRRTVANYSNGDVANPGKQPFLIRCEKTKARYIRLTGLRHGAPKHGNNQSHCLKFAGMEVLHGEENLARGCPVTARDSYEDLIEGYGTSRLTAGKTGYDAGLRRQLRAAPLLRGEFACQKPVLRATAYATALGNYELHINGSRVGDHCLAPGYTQYDKRVAVQTYDVTSILRSGKNAVGAVLADGWYRSRYRLDGYDQFKDFSQGRFGDAIPRFLLQIEIEYEDGTRDTVGTDGTWTCTMDGPYRRTSMYDGIVYDARQEVAGWCQPSFQGAGWSPVAVTPPAWKPYLWPQTVQPIARLREFKPVSVRQTAPGVWLCDFGQGVGGVCRVTLDGPSGMTVKLRHAMVANPDGTLCIRSLWGAYNNGDVYTLKGQGPQTFEAPFTFHGFRYVEITGMESARNLAAISAVMVADDCPIRANLNTSDARLNKLWNAILLTYQSCMKSVVVDVADRDERWGWMGDCGTVHPQSMAYLFDMPAFFRKRGLDLMDDQSADGYFPPQSPAMQAGGRSAVWSDAAVTIAWNSWLNYGDKRLLREMYPSIRKYVLVLRSNYESGKALWPHHFGDWLASPRTLRPGAAKWTDMGPPEISKDLMQKIDLIYMAQLFRRVADVLGEKQESEMIGAFVGKVLRDPSVAGLRKAAPDSGAQTAYALSLGWDAAEPGEAPLLMEKLVKAIDAYGGHLTTGTPSTTTLLKVLSDNGRHDLAYRLAMNPEFPSFGFMVDNGATTIWERFDTYVPGMGFNPSPMNGLNHMGFCSVAEWIFGCIAGIRPDPAQPGYKHFFIAPKLGGGLTSMKAGYDSIRGRIEIAYEIKAGIMTIHVTVPPDTTATVTLPAATLEGVTESGQPLAKAQGVSRIDAAAKTVRLQSGRYEFTIPQGKQP